MSINPQPQLEFIDSDNGRTNFKLTGVLDFNTVVPLAEQSLEKFFPYKKISIDLSNIHYANSAGLALLLEWQHMAIAHGKTVEIIQVPEMLLNLARISEVEEILNCQKTKTAS